MRRRLKGIDQIERACDSRKPFGRGHDLAARGCTTRSWTASKGCATQADSRPGLGHERQAPGVAL